MKKEKFEQKENLKTLLEKLDSYAQTLDSEVELEAINVAYGKIDIIHRYAISFLEKEDKELIDSMKEVVKNIED